MNHTLLFRSAFAFLGMLTLSACNQWATYPPVETTAKLSGPTVEPIPTLMTQGIRSVHERYGEKTGDFAINLPSGAPAELYDRIIKELGGGRPMTAPNETAYHVTEVRARDFDGEVDVIFTRPDGLPQFITVYLHKEPFGPYKVTDARLWRYQVQAPEPHYVAPPPAVERKSDEAATAQ